VPASPREAKRRPAGASSPSPQLRQPGRARPPPVGGPRGGTVSPAFPRGDGKAAANHTVGWVKRRPSRCPPPPGRPRGGLQGCLHLPHNFVSQVEPAPLQWGGQAVEQSVPPSSEGTAKPQPTGPRTHPHCGVGQEETESLPASPPGGQAATCRGVFTFPTTSSPRDSTPSAGRDITPHLQQRKQVQPDGGGTAATPLPDLQPLRHRPASPATPAMTTAPTTPASPATSVMTTAPTTPTRAPSPGLLATTGARPACPRRAPNRLDL
jgi:hypothetical protein